MSVGRLASPWTRSWSVSLLGMHAACCVRAGPATGNTTRIATLLLREDAVGLFERLLRPDVVPEAGNVPDIDRRTRVEPLYETPRLVGVIAFGDVLLDKGD